MNAGLPKIGISMGDPSGIGPEIIVKALEDRQVKDSCDPIIIGDKGIIDYVLHQLNINIKTITTHCGPRSENEVEVMGLTSLENLEKGRVSKEAGHASGLYIEEGVKLALKGEVDAIVTAPINKEAFNKGGFPYPGHTEFLAELTSTDNYAMMLMGESLKVILLTTHCPLMDVSRNLSIKDTLRILALSSDTLKNYFSIENPRLALASLNPHAGEGGLFGKEEEEILLPAAREARERGINVTDPMPSDTLFFSAVRGAYDAVICPYHDQGLIPLKLLHFEDGVNVTLGLPVIRTSPDHGTAFDIAGKGVANPDSMKAAILTAVRMAKTRKRLNKANKNEK